MILLSLAELQTISINNMNKNIFSFLFLFAFVIGIASVSFAQNSGDITNNPYSMRVIAPLAWNQEPYGIEDAVISVGPFDNYQISSSWGFAETDIIVNTANPQNFVATDNRITGFTGPTYVYYTTNSGVNWFPTTSGLSGNQGDPVFACDGAGNFYLAVLSSGVRVYKSTNGGASWTNLGNAFNNGSTDKEWIWCDQTNGTFQNNVYIAYVNFATGGSVDFWRSTNNGLSWIAGDTLAHGNQGANPGPNIAVGRDGRVYVAWNTSGGASLKYSTDGGATFNSTPISVSSYVQPGTLNSVSGRYSVKPPAPSANPQIRVNGMPQLAADLTTGTFQDNLYACYATNPPGPDIADVYAVRSTDKGLTWSAPVRVNDDNTQADQWMTDISVDMLGRVWVYWWDSRNDPLPYSQGGNILTETWGAVSTNGGVTFTNFKISNQNFNPNSVAIPQGTQHYYLGDYQGMSGKNVTFPCYTGQANTREDFTAYLPDYGISFLRPIDTVNHGQTSVNVVRAPMMGPYSGTVTYTASVTPTPSTGTITFNWVPSNVKTYTGAPDSLTLNTFVSAAVPYQNFTINVTAVESGGPRTHARSWTLTVANIVGIAHNSNDVPAIYALGQNYPNPFNPVTQIDYSLPKQSEVVLKVYDALGQEVATLVNHAVKQAGTYSETFNASNLPSGVYFYRISAGDYKDIRKMMLVK
jgi:Secretion system C-terminal sorting domain